MEQDLLVYTTYSTCCYIRVWRFEEKETFALGDSAHPNTEASR